MVDSSITESRPESRSTISPMLSWRFRRWGRVAGSLVFLGFVGPVHEVIASADARAIAALGAFAVCFLTVLELSHHPGRPGPVPALSVVRRWLLGILFAALIGLAAAMTHAFGQTWWWLFLFVESTAVVSMPARWAPAAIAVVAVVATVVLAANAMSLGGVASLAFSISMLGIVLLLWRRRGLLIEKLREAQGEVARLAVIEERLRFARDLHDLLGHSLSVIALKAELAGRLLDRGVDLAQIAAEVHGVEQIARRALEEVREAVTGYRAQSLQIELSRAVTAIEAAGAQVRTSIVAAALPPDIDDLLAWVVREAATNVVRHSRARRAEIELAIADGSVRLAVKNDGVLAPDATCGSQGTGSGLVGLRERLAVAGGRLTAGPADGGGFCVTATVSLGVAPAVADRPALS